MSDIVYTTPVKNIQGDEFNWDIYFKNRDCFALMTDNQKVSIFDKLRLHLKENHFEASLVLSKTMRALLKKISMKENLSVLEIGAATGFLSRWLLDEYSGSATLVDNNQTSIDAFEKLNAENHYNIKYINADIFDVKLEACYDVVCSFGLVEHFKDKTAVLRAHTQFLKPDGYVVILVPLDTRLNRVYWEVNSELNTGYRELITESQFLKLAKDMPNFELCETSKSYGYAYDYIAGIFKHSGSINAQSQ